MHVKIEISQLTRDFRKSVFTTLIQFASPIVRNTVVGFFVLSAVAVFCFLVSLRSCVQYLWSCLNYWPKGLSPLWLYPV